MNAEMKTVFARKPKQTRSRQSYDRMLDAATHILEEGGLPALTLSEVSRRSKVSIGSIYCRVDGKDDLLRAVQERALGQMDREFALLLMRVRRRVLPLRELVPHSSSRAGQFPATPCAAAVRIHAAGRPRSGDPVRWRQILATDGSGFRTHHPGAPR